jgi:hypothetical protein
MKKKSRLLTLKEIEAAEKEYAGEWYYYYKYGDETRGMKKCTFLHLIRLCTEVELQYMENNNEHKIVVKIPEFLKYFRRTETAAWAMYVEYLDKCIQQQEKSIATMQGIRRQVIIEHLAPR